MASRTKAFVLATWSVVVIASLVGGAGSALTEEEEFNTHSIELFLGAGTELADSTTGFGVGLGYEFRFIRWLGVGLMGEYMTGADRNGVLLFPVFGHPWRELRLEVAPGVEFADAEENFAIRFGASYEIGLWRGLSISPEFNVDLVDGEQTLIYGASLGWGF